MTAPPEFKRTEGAIAKIQALRAAEAAVAAQDGVVLVRGSDLRPEPVAWLWQHWLALGKLHILAGAPGQGKTTLALSMVATVTSGGRWPDNSRCDPGNVLIWSGEDDPADTLAPRLIAMGAAMDRVYFVAGVRIDGKPEPFDPARDLVALTTEAERIGSVRLLMVDPVVSAVSGDGHKNSEVRRGLQPLVDLGAVLNAAIIGITHFTKGSGGRDPTERVTGSIAFAAVARVVMVAAKVKGSEEQADRRILARSKSNIGPDDGGFEFDLAQVEALPGIPASRIEWGAAIAGEARELLAEPEEDDEGGPGDPADFLRELLAGGPLPMRDVMRHADEAGFGKRTIQRAMRRAGVQSQRQGFGGSGLWSLTTSRATDNPVAPRSLLGANGANGATDATPSDAEVF